MTEPMTLYLFDNNNYGEYYAVMSSSPGNALAALKLALLDHVENKVETRSDGSTYRPYQYERYLAWEGATLESLPGSYTLNEYGSDEVIWHERS